MQGVAGLTTRSWITHLSCALLPTTGGCRILRHEKPWRATSPPHLPFLLPLSRQPVFWKNSRRGSPLAGVYFGEFFFPCLGQAHSIPTVIPVPSALRCLSDPC